MAEQADNQAVQDKSSLVEAIFQAMQAELNKAGVLATILPTEALRTARFEYKQDPFSQQATLEGVWRDEKGHKKGEILFHGDGSFYAEFDIVQPHPAKPKWFIESVTAWGRDELIKADMKLLPAC